MTHYTQAVSGSSSKPAGSPPGSPTRAAEITTVAQQKMPTASPSARPLAAPQPPAFDFTKKMDEAHHQLFENRNRIEAQRTFNEIIEQAKSVTFPVYNTTIARCKIGMAKTYEPGSTERLKWVREAIQDIDTIFSKSDVWNLSEKDVIETYQILRGLLEDLKRGIPPNAEPTLCQGIEEKLEICKRKIPLLSDFDLYLSYAETDLSKEDRAGASLWFRRGLELINDKTEIPYRLARIDCLFKLAAIESESSHNNQIIRWAKQDIFELYDLREELFQIMPKREALLELYIFLTRLSDRLPTEFAKEHDEIAKRLQACREGVESIPYSLSEELLPLSEESSLRRRSGFPDDDSEIDEFNDLYPRELPADGSGRFQRLFALFVFAVLAISAVALYRRSIVKIN